MKLFVNNRHIKDIPVKFQDIENISDYIDNLEKKRLTKTERQNMTAALMQQTMRDFIEQLENNLVLHELIELSEPISACKIVTRSHTYYAIVFANKYEVRCDFSTYQSAPIKQEIKRLY